MYLSKVLEELERYSKLPTYLPTYLPTWFTLRGGSRSRAEMAGGFAYLPGT